MINFLMLVFLCLMLVSVCRSVKRIERSVRSSNLKSGQPADGINTPLIVLSLLVISATCVAEEPRTDPPLQTMHIGPVTRSWYRNPDGSCVQCALGMNGVQNNDLNAASILWDTSYGPAERGGSWPSRVEAYCRKRGIKAMSVTGRTVDDTIPYMQWACRTGRFAAIGFGTAHFQTLFGYDPRTNEWLVCDNNSPWRVDRYSDKDFRALHAASGPWCVILMQPSSPPPQVDPWWKK